MPTIRTPAPPIPSFTDGEFVTQRKLNAIPEHVRQLFDYRMSGFRTGKPVAIVADTVGSVANNAYSIRDLDTEIIDTDNIWSPSSPQAFTINTAGIYLVEFTAALSAPSSVSGTVPYLAALIYANGTVAESDTLAIVRTRIQVSQPAQVTAVVPIPLDEGTSLRFGIVQVTGSTQSIDGLGLCRASVEWLGPLDRRRGAVAL